MTRLDIAIDIDIAILSLNLHLCGYNGLNQKFIELG